MRILMQLGLAITIATLLSFSLRKVMPIMLFLTMTVLTSWLQKAVDLLLDSYLLILFDLVLL